MCGIAGVIGTAPEGLAETMIATLPHRGPDGTRSATEGAAQLAHARLSIIDLEGGWQPLEAAGSTVIGNGEIYNYLELIEEFGLKDRLKTGSDFEPLLWLYERDGPAAFDRLRGMYAFCLVGHDGRTWLVRDAFGIKPLYWKQEGGHVLFASEPRALLAVQAARPGVHVARAEELLTLNYTLGGGCIFQGVHLLQPGEVVEVTGGRVRTGRRRSALPPSSTPRLRNEAAAMEALDQVLEDSVRVHQRADVPYGLFLSGGIDSAVIATLMNRLNERPVIAFTCGFDAPGARDERGQAEAVARALDLDWRETLFGEEDFWRVLPKVAAALDEPTTDYATLPTYRLAEAAKGELTVVLTGEGGDELFAGYGRYRRALRPWWLGGRDADPQFAAAFLKDKGQDALHRWRQATQPPEGLRRLQQAQYRDIAGWLPGDLLLKLDRMLMAHGLEGRTPFLDPEVAAFAFHLPDHFKVRGRMGKWLLRRWLARHCRAAEPFARKKGFTVPVEAWITPRAQAIGPKVAAQEGVRQLCDTDAVRAVFSDSKGKAARWRLLFFALWHEIHVCRSEPEAALKRIVGDP
jgi:asparagine synthase (glutamine-hydrolysing)